MIQGGDPQGDGSGGPGYSIVEAPPEDLAYDEGRRRDGQDRSSRSRARRAASSSSSPARTPQLPPDYALLGKVTEGQDVVDLIGVAPVGPDEQPVEPIVIESVSVERRAQRR